MRLLALHPPGCPRERVLYRQPSSPNPLYYHDDQVDRPRAMTFEFPFPGSVTSTFLKPGLPDFSQVDMLGSPHKFVKKSEPELTKLVSPNILRNNRSLSHTKH